MSEQLQLRRDTTANILAMTPAQGEPIYDVSRKALVVGDGSTPGGDCVTPFSGIWSPQLAFGGTSSGMTYTTTSNIGWYQVANGICHAFFDFTLTAKGSSTGNATISGLPIPALTTNPHGGVNLFFFGGLGSGFVSMPHGYVDTATGNIFLVKSGGVTSLDMTDADFTNTTQLTGVAVYRIAQPTG